MLLVERSTSHDQHIAVHLHITFHLIAQVRKILQGSNLMHRFQIARVTCNAILWSRRSKVKVTMFTNSDRNSIAD